ncbi:S8 family serine peptidase [bacterium]|nr:S8 family serine peptidase [bacterium]
MSKSVFIVLLCVLFLAVGFWLGRGKDGRASLQNGQRLPKVRETVKPVEDEEAGSVVSSADYAEGSSAAAGVPDESAAAKKNAGAVKSVDLPYIEGELILRPKEGVSRAELIALLKERGIAVIGDIPELDLIRVSLPDDMSVGDAQKFLKEKDAVSETVRNAPVTLEPAPAAENIRQGTPVGSSALKLMSGEILGKGRDGDGILVAVLDTGVDDGNPSLAGQTFGGYDIVNDMAFVTDKNGHGTACASLIAGKGGEGGVLGAAPKAKILPVKVMDDSGKSDGFAIAKGIVYAVEKGAKVINLSLGTTSETTLLDSAIDYALGKGVLVVAASGNEGKEGENYPSTVDGVLCVGAVDGEKWKAAFSNYGPKIDLVAPGVLVAAAAPEGGVVLMSGTSAAVPLVSGAAASVWSENPNWSAEKVAEKLMAEADDLGSPGADDWYGSGLVNLYRALRTIKEKDLALASLYFDPPELIQGESTEMVAVFQNRGTERIVDGAAVIKIDEKEEKVLLPYLEPGASAEVRRSINLPEGRAKREMYLEIRADASSDARFENNGKRILISQGK